MICYNRFDDETGEPCGNEAVTILGGNAMCAECAAYAIQRQLEPNKKDE